MKKIKEHPYLLLTGIIFILLGIYLFFVNSSFVLTFIYTSVAFLLILLGISKFMLAQRTKMDTYSGVINIAIGTLFLFFHNYIVTIILGVALLILPVVRIVQNPNKKEAIKKELPLFAFGIFICFSGDLFVMVFFKIIGVLLMLLGVYQIISIFVERLQILKVSYETTPKVRKNVVDVKYEEVNKNEEE